MKLKLTLLLVLVSLPVLPQETGRQPDAIDVSAGDSINPVSRYFPENPNAPLSPKTSPNPFVALHPVYKTQPSIWFRPLQYSAPPRELSAKPTTRLPLMLAPAVTLPPSVPSISNPFLVPGFGISTTFRLKPEAKTKTRKRSHALTPPPAR